MLFRDCSPEFSQERVRLNGGTDREYHAWSCSTKRACTGSARRAQAPTSLSTDGTLSVQPGSNIHPPVRFSGDRRATPILRAVVGLHDNFMQHLHSKHTANYILQRSILQFSRETYATRQAFDLCVYVLIVRNKLSSRKRFYPHL